MKKNYITPKTAFFAISTAQMIALSGDLNRNQSITKSDDFGSRRGGSWDDDED